MAEDPIELNALELATELTIAWLGNPNTRSAAEDVPAALMRAADAVRSGKQALLNVITPY